MFVTQTQLAESTAFINTQSAGKYFFLWPYLLGNCLLTAYHWFLSLRKLDYSHAEHSSCLWVFLCLLCVKCLSGTQRLSRTNLTRSQTQFLVSSNPKPFLILNLCSLQLQLCKAGPIPHWCLFSFLLLSWQLPGQHKSRKAAQGIFHSLQWAIFDLLSQKTCWDCWVMISFSCQPRRRMLECVSHPTKHNFPDLLKYNCCLCSVCSAALTIWIDDHWMFWMRGCIVLGEEKKKSRAENSGTAAEVTPKLPQGCSDGWSKAMWGDRREQHPGDTRDNLPPGREECRDKTPNTANNLTKKIEKII